MKKQDKNKQDDLQKICDKLFLDGDKNFKGKVGVKELGNIMGLSEEEFNEYIKTLE